ncbi:hypothetical protein MPH_04836 [Macrophomina phaseolina MS6]|uniref:Uncharacterized protein n=1 Tax=Macrophomina phaseolina (strain MS6) TaxID=1126212 RepID=K2RYT7_MACPH|nr:hypothetical protein MPH_04836 [Macrophomina phaseolina MS6]
MSTERQYPHTVFWHIAVHLLIGEGRDYRQIHLGHMALDVGAHPVLRWSLAQRTSSIHEDIKHGETRLSSPLGLERQVQEFTIYTPHTVQKCRGGGRLCFRFEIACESGFLLGWSREGVG